MTGQARMSSRSPARLKALGIQTSDFSAYYDLVQALRSRGIPFLTIAPGDTVPAHVGALVTTAREAAARQATAEAAGGSAPAISGALLPPGPTLVVFTDPERTIDDALRALDGSPSFRRCIIGIDPGERPGIAVLADGRVKRLIHAPGPEAVRPIVESIVAGLPAERFVVRVGNGAPTFRDRILHTLIGMDAQIEVVDEAHSTPVARHGNLERDTQAATFIALTPGIALTAADLRPVVPTEGELRDIQRKSRLASEGMLTISRALARNVALGRLTLDEAIHRMQRGQA